MIWEETIKWLVYDCDGHEDFADSVKVAREYGFRVAFSQAQIDLVNKAIELYNKKAQGAEFKESVTTMYELMKELGVVREPEQDEGEG